MEGTGEGRVFSVEARPTFRAQGRNSCMDLGFLMSDYPERHIKIILFLTRINIFA
jgi:hypothetical protein